MTVVATPGAALAAGPPSPLDPQNWSTQENQTWSNYHALPGADYSDPSIEPSIKKWKVALVLTDFPDKPFSITQPAGGTVFGTPTAEANSIPRDQVPEFYRDFLNTPSALNHGQTMNRYWMEDSYGKYGVQLDAYGPYRMPGRSYQYFMTDFGGSAQLAHCPDREHYPCDKDFRDDARAAWEAEVGEELADSYDNIFFVSAGEDESSTWQEFGEMKFAAPEDVTDPFGPKNFDPTQENWAFTRYVPWTSWASASTIWPNASRNTTIEAESSGMATYAHELSHNLGIGDNYNNPFNTTQQRASTGPWDMLSRGSFGGPGGTHTRYLIPPTTGGSLGSQHNLRNKAKLGFVTEEQVLNLNRGGLAQSGMVVADVTAREVDAGDGLSGLRIDLDGGDLEPECDVSEDPLCDGGNFDAYTAEVVQQWGSDSFVPGHGVVLSKIKDSERRSCGTFRCFVWLIDAHPEDIGLLDFVGADGTPHPVVIGDQRQLNDASFNAGLNSGSSYEYEDTANRLHFYIIDLRTDADGVLHYKVGVKSL
ncbi:MAG TPA: M6 family metalloprotease domain-containing protein, partial [Solirubrobacter sp.]|nr:M6 family metalloprotease domain-containing protein [Solirubrobacter sp.]